MHIRNWVILIGQLISYACYNLQVDLCVLVSMVFLSWPSVCFLLSSFLALVAPPESKKTEHSKEDGIPVDIKLPVKHVLSRELQVKTAIILKYSLRRTMGVLVCLLHIYFYLEILYVFSSKILHGLQTKMYIGRANIRGDGTCTSWDSL